MPYLSIESPRKALGEAAVPSGAEAPFRSSAIRGTAKDVPFQNAGLRARAAWRGDRLLGVALDQGTALEAAQRLVRAGDDLLAVAESAEHLNVGGPGDAGDYGDELCPQLAVSILIHDVDALLVRLLVGGGLGDRCGLHSA